MKVDVFNYKVLKMNGECLMESIVLIGFMGAGKTTISKELATTLKDRKSTRLNSSHSRASRMPSSA